MQMNDIIEKKRDGQALSREEIEYFVKGYTEGGVPDYQASALLMAIYFRGMDAQETANLTRSMVYTGDIADLNDIQGVKLDKHSTGGVGDTTTLVAIPLVAACGCKVAKMSGRGLGHTTGTADKLQSIPGMRIDLPIEEFVDNVNAVGASVMGATGNFAPADKKIYALRDVTGTVNSIPLIASSIMSKKIAAGADAIVLDVKTGRGAFMQNLDDSFALARAMHDIGSLSGKRVMAVVTDMERPLGNAIGNALEVMEAVDVLRCKQTGPLLKVSLLLAENMLMLTGCSQIHARERLQHVLKSGEGFSKLQEMVARQGGDAESLCDFSRLPCARTQIDVVAPQSGVVSGIDAYEMGIAAGLLGAGRTRVQDDIDFGVGIWMRCRVGDTVQNKSPLCTLYVNDTANLDVARERVLGAFTFDQPIENRPLVFGIVSKYGEQRYDY